MPDQPSPSEPRPVTDEPDPLATRSQACFEEPETVSFAEEPILPPSRVVSALKGDSGTGASGVFAEHLHMPGYEILQELGRGGMGVVYKARQLKLKRIVAIKMILAGGHASNAELARFLAEAEAVAQMQHPNIVQLFGSGQHDGLPYFTLEFVSGGSLSRKLGGVPLPPRDAARLVEQLARAMHYAHERGIVHRDLKPANVLLSFNPEPTATVDQPQRSFNAAVAVGSGLNDAVPKITDFGLAKKLDDAAGLTASGAIVGTPSYMAPEQAAGGRHVGPAADVYALGAILYECLAGRPPFQGPAPLDTVMQVLADEPVPPRQLQPKTPPDLETICLKCLRKEPARRFAGALELAEDLRRFQAGEPIRARPVGRAERTVKWIKRRPLIAALLAAVVLVTASGIAAFAWAYGDALLARDDAFKKAELARLSQQKTENALKEVEKQKTNAQTEEKKAKKELRRFELMHYHDHIAAANRGLLENDFVTARLKLDECRWDLRHAEYHYLARQLAQKQPRGLFGHTSGVTSLALSADGKRLFSGSSDSTIKVWDLETWQ